MITVSNDDGRIGIAQLAELLDRKKQTIRNWEYQEMLPTELLPHRDQNDRRYWLPEQVEKLREWVKTLVPGSGLPGYNPSPSEIAQHVEHLQKSSE